MNRSFRTSFFTAMTVAAIFWKTVGTASDFALRTRHGVEKIYVTSQDSQTWFSNKKTTTKIFSTRNGMIASIESRHSQSHRIYRFITLNGMPTTSTDDQLAQNRLSALAQSPAVLQGMGHPQLITATVDDDSVYALIFMTASNDPHDPQIQQDHWHIDRNFLAPWTVDHFPFSRAILLNLNNEPRILKIYELPAHIDSLNGFEIATNLHEILSEYIYSDLRAKFTRDMMRFGCDRILFRAFD